MAVHVKRSSTSDILATTINGIRSSIGKWYKCNPRVTSHGSEGKQEGNRQNQLTVQPNDEEWKRQRSPCKILFFDSDDSGRRKIVEQVKLIHGHTRFVDKLGKTGVLGHHMDNAAGIVETPFTIDRLNLGLCDIGASGPLLRPREWTKLFENVTGVVFVVNLANYDQKLPDLPSQTRLMQSLRHFDVMVNSPHLRDTSIDLFMSNAEEFKQKLASTPLSEYFPDYEGGTDVIKAAKYLLGRYVAVNRANLSIYPHLIGRDATASSEVLFGAVKQMALHGALSEFGLVERGERRKSKAAER